MHTELAAVPSSLYNVSRANRVIASVTCRTKRLMQPRHAIVLFALLAGCTNPKLEQPLQEPTATMDASGFWEWFAANRDTIASNMRSSDQNTILKTLGEVDERLQRVAPGASFLYGHVDGENEFVATAGGVRDAIPSVQALIESAPTIAGWKFTAFRPPSGNGARITMEDLTLVVSDVTFQGFNLGEVGLGITLYPEGMTEDRRSLYQRAAITLMDHTIGEYDAMVLIDSLCVDPLSDLPERSKTTPLSELREFLHEVRGLNAQRPDGM